jgi:hypothetical protein
MLTSVTAWRISKLPVTSSIFPFGLILIDTTEVRIWNCASVVCFYRVEAVLVPPATSHLSAPRRKICIFQKKCMELLDWSLNIAVLRAEVICINLVAECVVTSCERTRVSFNWKVWSSISIPTIDLIVVLMEPLGLKVTCYVVWVWRLMVNSGRNNWSCRNLHFGDLHDVFGLQIIIKMTFIKIDEVYRWERREIHTYFWWRYLKERAESEDLGIDSNDIIRIWKT